MLLLWPTTVEELPRNWVGGKNDLAVGCRACEGGCDENGKDACRREQGTQLAG